MGLILKIHEVIIQLNTKKINNPPKIQAEDSNTFIQRRHNGQEAHEKMLSITNYYKNIHETALMYSLNKDQNGHHQKFYKQ